MKNLGTYYGTTLLDETDLVETRNKNKIELDYYGIKKHGKITKRKTFYGIAIVKKEYMKDEIKFERNIIEKITTNERKVVRIIEKLKNCKVTPIGMEDVLSDMLKQKAFQEE